MSPPSHSRSRPTFPSSVSRPGQPCISLLPGHYSELVAATIPGTSKLQGHSFFSPNHSGRVSLRVPVGPGPLLGWGGGRIFCLSSISCHSHPAEWYSCPKRKLRKTAKLNDLLETLQPVFPLSEQTLWNFQADFQGTAASSTD